jgi:ankyrin repeat protein
VAIFSCALLASDEGSRLLDAAAAGDVSTVRTLLAAKVRPSEAGPDGMTALHQAVRYDRLEVVNLLLAAGADVKAATRYKITPLSLACSNGSPQMIARLLEAGADPESTSGEGQTALMSAALSGKPEAVKLLLARGAKVNGQEPVRGQTALMWAAAEGNTGAVEMLIEFGADVKAKSRSGFTPLLFAVRNGHKETVRALLAHGADANATAPDGTSALNMAVLNAYFELAAVLLEGGANPNAPDARGSALHTLAWLRKPGSDGGNGLGRRSYGTPQPLGEMTALQLAKVLLEHGAEPNRVLEMKETVGNRDLAARSVPLITLGRHFLSFDGATAFYIAARNGDAPYMRLLAEHGADPKKTNALGITPLMVASGLDYWEGETPGPYTGVSEAERLEAVKLALELGNDINASADYCNVEMAGDPEYLLLYPPKNMAELAGKVPSDPRWSGSTALHGAAVSNQPSIVKFLLDHGANPEAKTKSGWTPLMMAGGTFFANARRDFPEAAALLRAAMAAK